MLHQIPSIEIHDADDASINFNQVGEEKPVSTKDIPGEAESEGGNLVGASPGMEGASPCVRGAEGDEEEVVEMAGAEPDLIQSVNSSSLGRETVALPVAPPRKKRRNKGSASMGDVSDCSM